ncbi:hypothetical protein BZA70DRAFT_116162 [Myxozyma melibiosi]|uniref:JmjC domain-containing protein n=1 Tax=Myxozyma melibiosi TaxID=54550 RepID=A0ABR1FAI7_9ASCO
MGKIQVVQDIAREIFVKEYLRRGVPCLFKSQFRHLPALKKWMVASDKSSDGQATTAPAASLNLRYFMKLIDGNGRDPFVDVETGRFNPNAPQPAPDNFTPPTQTVIQQTDFTRTEVPLSLFLKLHSAEAGQVPEQFRNIYLAQTPLLETLPALKDDFVPRPVYLPVETEKHVYGCSAWIGRKTFTPRHFDPNENLYVMVAGRKRVTLWKPEYDTKDTETSDMEKLNKNRKRGILGNRNFGEPKAGEAAYDSCILEPGDGLFIPERWWHEVESIGDDVSASVNWWFREPTEKR